MVPRLTKDHSDNFFSDLKLYANALKSDPMKMMMVMKAESDVRSNACNPNGNASGLIQFMPVTQVGMGWRNGDAAFRQLNSTQQLPFVGKYYKPYIGHLDTIAGLYVATFLPAYIKHAHEPNYVLTFKGEGRGFYEANSLFDVNGNPTDIDTNDLKIQVHELEDYVRRACVGQRWQELVARLTGNGLEQVERKPLDIGTIAGMQYALNELGFDTVVDGQWGPKSKASLEKFQYDHNLKVDGIYGPTSRKALQEEYEKLSAK